jgi:ABC-2 type transporter
MFLGRVHRHPLPGLGPTVVVAVSFLMRLSINFVSFVVINFLLGIASSSMGVLIRSAVEDPTWAAELMPALIVPQLLFSGFLHQHGPHPDFLEVGAVPVFVNVRGGVVDARGDR